MLAVFAVEEGELLLAVARIVGRVRIQEDFLGNVSLGVPMPDKPPKTEGAKPIDGLLVGVILQARERRLRGQRIGFADDGLKGGIASQRVGVVAVLIACGDLVDPLTEHLVDVVLDKDRMAPVVNETPKPLGERQLLVKLAQEQKSRVAGDLATVKIQDDFGLKTERELIMTLCSHRSSVGCGRLVW